MDRRDCYLFVKVYMKVKKIVRLLKYLFFNKKK
jgi:hypothetical protein